MTIFQFWCTKNQGARAFTETYRDIILQKVLSMKNYKRMYTRKLSSLEKLGAFYEMFSSGEVDTWA